MAWAGNVFEATAPLFAPDAMRGGSPWATLEFRANDYTDAVQRILDEASRTNRTTSVHVITDRPTPTKHELRRGEQLIGHPLLRSYFGVNPSPEAVAAFPTKVCGYPRAMFNATGWEAELRARAPLPLPERPEVFLCIGGSDGKYGRADKARALSANGFNCSSGSLPPAEYMRRLRSAQAVFAPRGAGAAEHKFWEIAAAGALIVTDADESQRELLRGIPTLMLRGPASWQALTPESLQGAIRRVAARPLEYDASRAMAPYWLGRLAMGCTNSSRSSDGRMLALPMEW